MLRDYSVAFERLLLEAEQGDAQAQQKLGLMYGLGLGCTQDYAQAFAWYRRAAEQGVGQAQNNLGFMYGTGRGVPQDYVYAYAWYSIAAAAGEETARSNRDIVADLMSRGQVESAQALSRELFDGISRGTVAAG